MRIYKITIEKKYDTAAPYTVEADSNQMKEVFTNITSVMGVSIILVFGKPLQPIGAIKEFKG